MSTVSSIELRTKLRDTYLCRCRFWVICNEDNCYHYEPHDPSRDRCILMNPVKWCRRIRGFVHCIPINEIDSNYECDPNLAFKAKLDAEKREKRRNDNWHTDRHGRFRTTSSGITREDDDEYF